MLNRHILEVAISQIHYVYFLGQSDAVGYP